MMTFKQFAGKLETIPASTSWYLADLGEARGRQELYTRQAPQKLKALREHALIESAVSSNRIEGVTVEERRIKAVILGKELLHDRNEEEVRGYRQALDLIHSKGAALPLSEQSILEFHRLTRGDIWDAGKFKEKDGDIIERYPDGRERLRFKTVKADKTSAYMAELLEMWNSCLRERWAHPLIALAAFNLDFLCIHPFRDGNGRVSRLLLLLQCYHLGYEVGRYISLERLIEENKERYYETLELSSRGWHEGKHDPWHYVNYLLFILKTAYREFESRVGDVSAAKGAKTATVLEAIRSMHGDFSIKDIQKRCPAVGIDLIRRILRQEREATRLECLGRGPDAHWRNK
ncbi:MAG: Filamentation induced by cAMP protein [Geobacteraceae bacterium]|nr:MAG: Filamentation induced by cAMP protein [Geobacteraceae bacterium]